MPSNRKHPDRLCINPYCGEYFIPTDKRHYYHIPQCRSNYNNDKRDIAALFKSDRERILGVNDWIVWCYFNNPAKGGLIMGSVLTRLGFDFLTGTWHENIETLRPVLWVGEYGLEMTDKELRIFEIHKRTKN